MTKSIQARHRIELPDHFLRLKTRPNSWIDTDTPVIIPISLESKFASCRIKLSALLKLVKENVKGRITLLICEGAHRHTLTLKHGKNTKDVINNMTSDFMKRSEISVFEITTWNEFVLQDPMYHDLKLQIEELYSNDLEFRKKLLNDAKNTYTEERSISYPDKSSYMAAAQQDLMEHCIFLLTAVKNGYKYEFYPGATRESAKHYEKCRELTRVNVTLGTIYANEKLENYGN